MRECRGLICLMLAIFMIFFTMRKKGYRYECNHTILIRKTIGEIRSSGKFSNPSAILFLMFACAKVFIFQNRREHLKLGKVSFEIDQIRKYRNRFSHNGSLLICGKRQIPCYKIHNMLLRIMKEIGANSILTYIKKIDRFNEVFTDGKKAGFITCGLQGIKNKGAITTRTPKGLHKNA